MPVSQSSAQAKMNMLCDSVELKHVLHSYPFIRGVVFAVAAAPEIPMPEVWLPWAIKQNNQLTSIEQADNLTDVLMSLLQHQLKQMSDEVVKLPSGISFDDSDAKGVQSHDSELSQWCQGILLGHGQLEHVWQDAWNKMQVTDSDEMCQLQKDLSHCLYMLTTFADIPLAVKQAEKRGNDQLLNILPKIFLSFPQTLKTYVGLSDRLVDFLPNQFETFVQK